MFPMGTLLFQASQPDRSGKDMLVSIDTIKCFLDKIGERYSFNKKPDSQVEKKMSPGPSVNEVMETIMKDENEPSTQDQFGNATDEDGLMELFDQISSLMSLMSDWLELDTTIVINEASLQGKSATYQITI